MNILVTPEHVSEKDMINVSMEHSMACMAWDQVQLFSSNCINYGMLIAALLSLRLVS